MADGCREPACAGTVRETRLRRAKRGEAMELHESQYQNALKLAKGADDALQQLMTCLKRHDEPSRIRRVIEDVEVILKKVKRGMRVG